MLLTKFTKNNNIIDYEIKGLAPNLYLSTEIMMVFLTIGTQVYRCKK
jgi:hypothetical protein